MVQEMGGMVARVPSAFVTVMGGRKSRYLALHQPDAVLQGKGADSDQGVEGFVPAAGEAIG